MRTPVRPPVRSFAPAGLPLADDRARDEGVRETRLMVAFRERAEPAAFEELYLSSRAGLLTWIQYLLAVRREGGDPADLLQDTFVNIHRYAHTFREDLGDGYRGWARAIAGNVVRRASRRRSLSLCSLAELGFEPQDRRAAPELESATREEVLHLGKAWMLVLLHYSRAWGLLSARDREALHMVEVEGLNYAETGERLGVGPSNMKMIVFRARKRLRAHILRAMTPSAPVRSPARASA